MFRAAFKSLLGRKVRLLMSTFAIVLGVGFVTGSLIFGDTLNRSFTALFSSTVGDVVVRPAGSGDSLAPSTVTLPASLEKKLAAVDGAARVDGNIGYLGVYVIGENGQPVGGNGPPALGGNYTDAPAGHGLAGLQITDGRPPQQEGEIALDSVTADNAGYEVGDTVPLVTTTKSPELDVELVGIVGFPEGGSLNGATFTVFDTETAQELFLGGENAFHDYWVTAEEGVSQEQLRDDVAEILPDEFEAVTGDEAADEAATELIEQLSFITTFLLIFAVIALVVGSFLIVNTFSILVAQRSRELALLRALGASRRQVKRMVLFEAFVLGVVGASIGLGLGVLLFLGIRALFGQFGLDLGSTPMVFSPTTVLAALAIGVGVTMFAAWLPARRTGRIPPVAALRDDVALPEATLRRRFLLGIALGLVGCTAIGLALFGDIPKAGWVLGGGALAVLFGAVAASPVLGRPVVAGAGALFARLHGTVGRLAGQNLQRNPRRTAATASALMIGLALCTTMAIVGASAKASVDRAVEESFVGDYVLSNVFGMGFSPTIADRAEQVDGVAEVTRIRFQYTEAEGSGSAIQGVDPDRLGQTLEVEFESGDLDALTDGRNVAVSAGLADELGVTVGDQVEIEVPTGEGAYSVSGVYADNPLLGDAFLMSLANYTEAGWPEVDNFVFVGLEDGADRDEVKEALDALVEKQTMLSVKDQEGLAQEARGPIDTMLTLIYGLLALALVIAVLGIVNTLALSVIERTREIGLLRAIGMSRRQMRRMIRLESMVISFLGALLGVALGLFFGWVLLTDLADEGLEVIAIPWLQLVGFLLVSLLVGVLAAVFPARRAARLDVLDAIAEE